ncbi:Zn-dependent exopeptidase [Leucogyrophana mollusca]|uniref:Zn-dependent exopeptidase n=1 Tax=Leucogyrophana mollusca TaxID=85980 RepID=A0ACB8B6Q0_9AGAM|nr:Zn-dependent exopeptidase [Leucogyrophana mollusca]
MKSLALVSTVLLSRLIPVACAGYLDRSAQVVLNSPALRSDYQYDEAYLGKLLEIHNDPVEVMRLVDPSNAAKLDEPRLLQVFGRDASWMTEGDKLRLRREGLKFVDLTDHQDLKGDSFLRMQASESWPKLQYQEKVHEIIGHLSIDSMQENLRNLTSFYNRYYLSNHGVKSSRWVYDQILKIISTAPPSVRLSLETFTHPFPQSSIIARFEPTYGRAVSNGNIALPRIVLGTHMDSANYRLPLLPSPGADDDGSGTVALIEAFRALVEGGFRPERPVEFHWYAAEEAGLLGSLEVAKEYKSQNKQVQAMFQLDALAFVRQGTTPTISFITSGVDASLTNWTMAVASEYASAPIQGIELPLGHGSDHMPWDKIGVPVAAATEEHPDKANPYEHTEADRIDLANGEFSFEFIREFTKVAIGFVVELGGWVD